MTDLPMNIMTLFDIHTPMVVYTVLDRDVNS